MPPHTSARGRILSAHYPAHDADLSSKALPKLNDEFGHVACYNLDTLRRDPGVRDTWGTSLRKFWSRMFAADGCLGGAIWGLVDEVFLKSDAPTGYGEWGIVDGWRRPKPEYWHVKKAYSPVRIEEGTLAVPGAGETLAIPVGNWFDHTNLGELAVRWRVGAEGGLVTGLEAPPHGEGRLVLPPRAWRAGDVVELVFERADGLLVDRFHIGRPAGRAPKTGPGARARYRSEPGWAWALDEVNWQLDGPGARGGRDTNDFRSLKANFLWAAAELAGSPVRVRAESDGTGAVRCAVQADGRVQLHILNQWVYPDLGWGNISAGLDAAGNRSGEVRLRLVGGAHGLEP
jgi:hypothetical protein